MVRILLVDDHPGFLHIMSAELTSEGYEVITALNGKQALQKIEECNPDLVLLDIMMPVMNGFDTLARLREGSALPVIVLSSDVYNRAQAMQLGADDFIVKPFEAGELLEKIYNLVPGELPVDPY